MTVGVGVSGGMDSLLSLVLLKEQGYEVKAVHAHFLAPGPEWERITQGLTHICRVLGIPFHAVDMHEAFERCVVAPFVAAYKAGLTPNPCAVCNSRMKFGALFRAVQGLGCECFATGHYVNVTKCHTMGRMLVRGADRSKDQSYFLSLVPIDVLRRSHFPLAEVRKSDVPALLARYDLEPLTQGESQEICFVPEDDYQAFLLGRETMPGGGPAILSDGTVVGNHKGLWRHTQGQRRGLGIAWKEALYVLDKDVKRNHLIVGPKNDLASHGCIAGQVNLMTDVRHWPDVVMVQTRYRQKAKPSRVEHKGDKLVFRFLDPHVRPTPGQVAAVYTEDGIVLGGGVIENSL